METVTEGATGSATMASASTSDAKVLNNFGQTAYLSATYRPNSQPLDPVFFYNLHGPGARSWSFTYEECQIIYAQRQVSVTAKSKHPDICGVFSIGERTNYYYSHSLWKQPEALKERILELLAFALTGE